MRLGVWNRPVVALALGVGILSGLGPMGTALAQDQGRDWTGTWSGGRALLPYEQGFRAGAADERRRREASFSSPRWNDASQRESMERLERVRILLREVLVMLRQSPESERRDRALAQALEALIRTQNAMTWLPREDRHRAQPTPSLEHGWGERASGGPVG